ncbi:hypothetical protein T440DRAFT_74811 [Plenodomus tracheiphilus IPT5]|uniref:Uncharacterized protein n=1 Tax=Plenodomus tracheiphilus IPT5 TaxID=1408161 RepID=A0A6A7B677_9PLEO|nr:hypothetical protein T440DRAFT_74811 [Plenodomus tracheiphilus IPT5]
MGAREVGSDIMGLGYADRKQPSRNTSRGTRRGACEGNGAAKNHGGWVGASGRRVMKGPWEGRWKSEWAWAWAWADEAQRDPFAGVLAWCFEIAYSISAREGHWPPGRSPAQRARPPDATVLTEGEPQQPGSQRITHGDSTSAACPSWRFRGACPLPLAVRSGGRPFAGPPSGCATMGGASLGCDDAHLCSACRGLYCVHSLRRLSHVRPGWLTVQRPASTVHSTQHTLHSTQ